MGFEVFSSLLFHYKIIFHLIILIVLYLSFQTCNIKLCWQCDNILCATGATCGASNGYECIQWQIHIDDLQYSHLNSLTVSVLVQQSYNYYCEDLLNASSFTFCSLYFIKIIALHCLLKFSRKRVSSNKCFFIILTFNLYFSSVYFFN